MKHHLTAKFVRRVIAAPFWDFGNKVLYDLCAQNPGHTREDVIVAKVWLIGRSYSAAIERKRNSATTMTGDDFYQKRVGPRIARSEIDDWFRRLRMDENLDPALSLEIHGRLTDLFFHEVSGLENRSLASKYLHFHFPERFYLYDSRAAAAIGKLTEPSRLWQEAGALRDQIYARFWLRCECFNQEMVQLVNRRLTPRELDKVLLTVSEDLGA